MVVAQRANLLGGQERKTYGRGCSFSLPYTWLQAQESRAPTWKRTLISFPRTSLKKGGETYRNPRSKRQQRRGVTHTGWMNVPFSTEVEGCLDRRKNPLQCRWEGCVWRQMCTSADSCFVRAPGTVYMLWPGGKPGKETKRTWGKCPLDWAQGCWKQGRGPRAGLSTAGERTKTKNGLQLKWCSGMGQRRIERRTVTSQGLGEMGTWLTALVIDNHGGHNTFFFFIVIDLV